MKIPMDKKIESKSFLLTRVREFVKNSGNCLKNWSKQINQLRISYLWLFIFILIISSCVRLYYFQYRTSIDFFGDELVYMLYGKSLSYNLTDFLVGDYSGMGQYFPKTLSYPPTSPYLLGISFYLFGVEDGVARMLMFFISLLSIAGVYILGSKLFNSKIGALSSFFFAFAPLQIIWSSYILADILSSFLIALTLLLIYYAVEKDSSSLYFITGFTLGIGFMNKYTLGILYPIIAVYVFLSQRYNLRRTFLKTSFIFFSSFLPMIPWFINNYKFFGNPFMQPLMHLSVAQSSGNKGAWYFYLLYHPNNLNIMEQMFSSFLWILALIGIAVILYRYRNSNPHILMLTAFSIIFIELCFLNPKVDRKVITLLPALAVIAALGLDFLMNLSKDPKIKSLLTSIGVLLLFSIAHTSIIVTDKYYKEWEYPLQKEFELYKMLIPFTADNLPIAFSILDDQNEFHQIKTVTFYPPMRSRPFFYNERPFKTTSLSKETVLDLTRDSFKRYLLENNITNAMLVDTPRYPGYSKLVDYLLSYPEFMVVKTYANEEFTGYLFGRKINSIVQNIGSKNDFEKEKKCAWIEPSSRFSGRNHDDKISYRSHLKNVHMTYYYFEIVSSCYLELNNGIYLDKPVIFTIRYKDVLSSPVPVYLRQEKEGREGPTFEKIGYIGKENDGNWKIAEFTVMPEKMSKLAIFSMGTSDEDIPIDYIKLTVSS